MAIVEHSDGELLSESENDSVEPKLACVASDRQDFRHVRRNDVEKNSQLLKRRCPCAEGSCFTQLRGKEADIRDLRREFHGFLPNRKDAIRSVGLYFVWFCFFLGGLNFGQFQPGEIKPEEILVRKWYNITAADPVPASGAGGVDGLTMLTDEGEILCETPLDDEGEVLHTSSEEEVFLQSDNEGEVDCQPPGKKRKYAATRTHGCALEVLGFREPRHSE